jgi:hypothetical protein
VSSRLERRPAYVFSIMVFLLSPIHTTTCWFHAGVNITGYSSSWLMITVRIHRTRNVPCGVRLYPYTRLSADDARRAGRNNRDTAKPLRPTFVKQRDRLSASAPSLRSCCPSEYNRVVAQPCSAAYTTPEKTVRDVDRRIIAIWCGRGRAGSGLVGETERDKWFRPFCFMGSFLLRAWRWRWRDRYDNTGHLCWQFRTLSAVRSAGYSKSTIIRHPIV